MKLNLEQIKAIATGAVRAEEANGAVRLYRFTKEQEELYRVSNPDFYEKSFAAAGIKLYFRTDSTKLKLKVSLSRGSSRQYFSVDVLADGKVVGYLDNFSEMTLPKEYAKIEFPDGILEKEFGLGEGIKEVCVHLPWSRGIVIEELSIDDGAFTEAVKPRKKLLVYGDSITQGYDALRPSERYPAKLADVLGAEELNKGIGGEVFRPELAALKDDFSPDYITVAYGTNDWGRVDRETFRKNCCGFYTALSQNYPEAKIFAITPIWRKDWETETAFGSFADVEKEIRDAVKDLKNVTVISGIDFVPKDENYFSDLYLHPNDEGFAYYFANLWKAVQDKI